MEDTNHKSNKSIRFGCERDTGRDFATNMIEVCQNKWRISHGISNFDGHDSMAANMIFSRNAACVVSERWVAP